MKLLVRTAIAAAALMAASPSFAQTCSASDPEPDAEFCVAVSGNANSGNPAGTAAELNAMLDDLGTLAGTDFGDVDWAVTGLTKGFFEIDGEVLSFEEMLFGEQIISIHFGGGAGGGETVMYLFDFGLDGALSVDLNQGGFSNAVIITPPGGTPPVPEPATWAMMLLGFGATGFAMRRRRRVNGELLQIA